MKERELRKIVDGFGATLERENNGFERIYVVTAPRRHHWADTGSISLIAWRDDEGRRDLAERMEIGVELCDADCDCWGTSAEEGR